MVKVISTALDPSHCRLQGGDARCRSTVSSMLDKS
jgi:hypothetical protein